MRYSRRVVVAWSAAGGVAGATVGGSIAWFIDNGVTADWFGAIGTWVGSIGTIGTIWWAVVTFRQQQREKLQDAIDAEVARREQEAARRAAEFEQAKRVTVSCWIAETTGGAITRIGAAFANGLAVPVTITGVRVVHSASPSIARHAKVLSAGSSDRLILALDPPLNPGPGETKASFSGDDVVMTYDVEGVRWSRTGSSDPVRV